MIAIDTATLSEAMGGRQGVDYSKYTLAVNEALLAANCTTPLRAAHFLAQIAHESGGLMWWTELSDGLYLRGRADLGHAPGEGEQWKGRGPIQLTGKANYRKFGEWCKSRGLVSDAGFFVANPTKVAEAKWGMLAAVYYWTVARPQLNSLADADDLVGVTRAINGGTNGLADRRANLARCKALGARILPREVKVVERVIPYSRKWVTQNTGYYCGPASVQTIILGKTGRVMPEAQLANQLGTTVNGTDYIGQFPPILNQHIPGAGYRHEDIRGNDASPAEVEALWKRVKNGVDGGFGLVANFMVPPSNYPRAVAPSTISPAYGGGMVYHYVACMGYGEDGRGRRVWIADSGFAPYGYWMDFRQFASCIAGKGYAYPTAKAPSKPPQKPKEVVVASGSSQLDRIEKSLVLVMDQLVGYKKDDKGWLFSGWDSTGNKTLVNAVGSLMDSVKRIESRLDKLEKEGK